MSEVPLYLTPHPWRQVELASAPEPARPEGRAAPQYMVLCSLYISCTLPAMYCPPLVWWRISCTIDMVQHAWGMRDP